MPAERVLIVDDSATQREAAKSVLESHGLAIELAVSGEEALEAVRMQRFDLVLSDVVMPGMSGFELCARIKRELAEPPPVVLLTNLSDPRDIVRGVECGADNYITKPYAPEYLGKRVREVLTNQALRRPAEPDGSVTVHFLGEEYRIRSNPPQILALLLSSFEELIRTNNALRESERLLADAHARELKREQEARARAEEDARRMEALMQKAEAATRARDDVLAMVSHDLKNPLGTIFTSAELLLEMDLPEESQKRQLEIVRRTALTMDRLIEDLLDVSRIEAGRFSIQAEPESASGLVMEARELFASMAGAQEIDLVAEPLAYDRDVLVDRRRVLQVFSNLIGNALKFTPSGGRVTVRGEPDGDSVRFMVIDTGPGIAEEDLPHIFDRFWHAGNRSGAGLGLAIAKGIVDAHQGRIWTESGPGGSTFAFSLPTAPEEKPS